MLVLGCGALGCGAGTRGPVQDTQAFECKNRIASYSASHHMGGDELGVELDCAAAGPRIKRWRTDRNGKREEAIKSLPPGEFERAWHEIDGTGWPNLKDCASSSGSDPIYVFDIKDDQNQATFQCRSRAMPYPYNTIVDPLDFAAQAAPLGDDDK